VSGGDAHGVDVAVEVEVEVGLEDVFVVEPAEVV
jgi:hypothetical protein